VTPQRAAPQHPWLKAATAAAVVTTHQREAPHKPLNLLNLKNQALQWRLDHQLEICHHPLTT